MSSSHIMLVLTIITDIIEKLNVNKDKYDSGRRE
jgi:hypothetical protein